MDITPTFMLMFETQGCFELSKKFEVVFSIVQLFGRYKWFRLRKVLAPATL